MGRRRKARGRTRVFVVQDKSGSMAVRREATVSGFNEYIDQLDDNAEGDIELSLIQFDTKVYDKYINRPLENVDDLTPEDFVPSGMTALRDGVGRAIRTADKSIGDRDKVLIVIMTDGEENSSREYTQTQILDLIGRRRAKGWEFVFLGAGEEAWNAGANLGFVGEYAAHSINYSGLDAHDHQSTYAALATSTANLSKGGDARFDAGVKRRMENKAKAEVGK
jgi:Mg-chelatase subunit ChlD